MDKMKDLESLKASFENARIREIERQFMVDYHSLTNEEQEEYSAWYDDLIKNRDKVRDSAGAEQDARRREEEYHSFLESIPLRYRSADVDSLSPVGKPIARHLLGGRSGIVYSQTAGTGKTYLTWAVLKHLQASGKRCAYVKASDVFSTIKRSYSKQDFDIDAYLGKLTNCDTLAVDEVDKGFRSHAEYIYLFDIINTRYDWLRQTILIGNFEDDAEVLESLKDTIVSRLCEEGKIMRMEGNSYRKT